MLRLSCKPRITRTIVFSTLILSCLAMAGYFIANQLKDSNAITKTGDRVAVRYDATDSGKINYGTGPGKDGATGHHTRHYTVITSEGTFEAYCAQPRRNDPRDESVTAAVLPIDPGHLNNQAILLLIYLLENQPTNPIFDQVESSSSWGNNQAHRRYTFTHAIIGALYANDYIGLSDSEKNKVNITIDTLKTMVDQNSVEWQATKPYQLLVAKSDSTEDQDVVWIERTGTIIVQKRDANTGETPQGNASFEGITFTLYDGATPIATQALGPGMTSVTFTGLGLDFNKPYTITESPGSNTSYNHNATSSQVIQIPSATQPGEAIFYNTVNKGSITINKIDKETSSCTTVTDKHSFAGTTFQLINTSASHPIYYNGNIYGNGAVIATQQFSASNCSITFTDLPYGTYQVKEVAAGARYALNNTPVNITIPKDNNYAVSFTFENQPIRGDVKFIKKDPANNVSMENAYFSISSVDENNNIMETHIVVADHDGVVDTSKNPHSFHTNGYDELYDSSEVPMVYSGYGTWFGKNRSGQPVPVNDSVGALPYGAYIIQELRCDANLFCSDIINEKVTIRITTHNQIVDLGDWDNTCAQFTIETEATDKEDGNHYVEPGQDTVIVDHISYCAKKNYTFTIVGTLMKKNATTGEAEPYLVNGEKVEKTVEVKPTTDCDTLDMEFPITVPNTPGESLVVFEKLYYKESLKTKHEEIDDEGQTIHIVKLGTIATDNSDDDKLIVPNEETIIKDTASYCIGTPGIGYTITGVLMDKTTGNPIMSNGEPVTQSVYFTPEQKCGTVEMVFPAIDTTSIIGHPIVVFETLFLDDRMIPTPRYEKIISHEDLNDEEQTVYVIDLRTTIQPNENGTKLFPRDSDIAVKDTVHYCLQPGKEYTVKGIVMDKETGNGILVNSAPVESSVTFTPTEPCGETEMIFNFNTTNLGGARLVVFESLYYNNELIIEHKDINNEDESFEIDINAPETGYAAKMSTGTTETNHIELLFVAAFAIIPSIVYGANHIFVKRKVTFKG